MSFRVKTLPPWIPSHWPNRQTVTTSLLLIINIAGQIFKHSMRMSLSLTIPVRVISLIQAVANKRRYKIALDTAAFGTLFSNHNRLLSIGIDAISEVINFYDRPKALSLSPTEEDTQMISPTNWLSTLFPQVAHWWYQGQGNPDRSLESYGFGVKRLDTSVPENAYIILNIPEDKRDDLDFIHENYTQHVASLEKRKSKASEPLRLMFQDMIEDRNTSYQTLCSLLGGRAQ